MKYHKIGISAAAGIVALLLQPAMAVVVTFEEFDLSGSGHLNDSSPAADFVSQGVTFKNTSNPTYDSWTGFAISNTTDTITSGYLNQYSAITGSGAGGTANYTVGYYTDYEDSTHMNFGGTIDLTGIGASFTNTTYAALSMRDGDGFAKKFGGQFGDDADWFKLTIAGYVGGLATGTSIDFYLADYRFEDNSQDYILDKWQYVAFSALGIVDQIRFSLSPSDNGQYGMNTPSTFAMDSLVVPEPSTLLCSLAGFGLALRRKR